MQRIQNTGFLAFTLVFAAALLLVAATPASATPQIAVYQNWDNVEVPHGNSFAYSNIAVGASDSRLFRIENNGTSDLTISNASNAVSGAGFIQLSTPSSPVGPGGSTTIRVRIQKSSAGMSFGELTLNTNASPSSYVVHLAGSAGTFAPPSQSLFTLSSAERNVWTPPSGQVDYYPSTCEATLVGGGNYWTGTVGSTAEYLWKSFCNGYAVSNPSPPSAYGGSSAWFSATASGSQNHGILHFGTSALGHALLGNATDYDVAADKAIQILKLDLQPNGQGHMRHEAVGQYSGLWEGGVAAMALAGQYQPNGATKGAELLAAARNWWRDHVAILRQLRVADGQVALVGARINGEYPFIDYQDSMTPSVNIQLASPIPYSNLHPWIQAMIDSNGQPGAGFTGPYGKVNWRIPKDVAERWIVLRAVQLGAIPTVSQTHPVRCLSHHTSGGAPADVYRWTSGGRTYTGLDWVYGYAQPGVRWQVSWGPVSGQPGSVMRVEHGENCTNSCGKGPRPSPGAVTPSILLIPGCS